MTRGRIPLPFDTSVAHQAWLYGYVLGGLARLFEGGEQCQAGRQG